MVGAGHATYIDRFHEFSRLVPHLVTSKNKRIERYIYGLAPPIRAMVAATEPTTIQSVILKAGMLTVEAIRNGALKKISEKRGNNGEPSRDGNARDDNKRSRMGRAFATTTNPVRKEYTINAPKCTNCNYHHQLKVPCRLCTNCNRFRHLAKDCKVRPRVVNPPNARNPTAACGACFECSGMDHYKVACNRASRPGGNLPNQAMIVEGGQGCGNNGDQVRGRAFMMGALEARQDPNRVTGTFTLDNHYATTLFDCGADYSFVSTTFMLLLDIDPSNLGFSYEIEITSGQLVEINEVIREMDWFSRHKAEIVCYEKTPARLRLLRIGKPLELHHSTFEVKKQERAFQTLKDKLYIAPVLALPDGSKDFLVYYDASGEDEVCVLQKKERLTKSAHFLPICEDYKMDRLAKLYLNEIIARHGVPISIIFNRNSDHVLLKVSPRKGADRFGKKGKLAPRFVGPFEITERIDDIQVDAKLNFIEELVEILEREFKKLKRSRIAIVKVRWNLK
ncbi:putative reverse transcriptase domain-containing protein [Tanacetum coccineum]